MKSPVCKLLSLVICHLSLVVVAIARAETNTVDSIYDLGQTWTNQDGRAVAMDELRGKVRVAVMFFTSCKFACPRITADLKAIEAKLPAEQKKKANHGDP